MNFTVKPNFKEVGKVFGPLMKDFQNKLLELSMNDINKLKNNEVLKMSVGDNEYDVTLNMVDESTQFGACWKSSGNSFGNAGYINTEDENDRVNIIGNSNYESGVPGSNNNGNSSSSSNNSVNDSVTSTGTGVIGMHINSKNKVEL